MRWIKASEGKPANKVDVVIKEYSGLMDIGWYSEEDERFHTESDLGPLSIHQVYWLDESIPADLEQEAERLYPYNPGTDNWNTCFLINEVADKLRSAHITAARQYMDTIERLTRENHKLMAENDTLSEELGELKNITDGLDARVINQKADLLIAYRNKLALTPGITVETILAMLEDDIKTLRAMGGAEIVKSIIDPSNDKS